LVLEYKFEVLILVLVLEVSVLRHFVDEVLFLQRFYFLTIRVVQLRGQCFLTSATAILMSTCSEHEVLVLVLEAWVLVLVLVLEVSVLVLVLVLEASVLVLVPVLVLEAWVLVLVLVHEVSVLVLVLVL